MTTQNHTLTLSTEEKVGKLWAYASKYMKAQALCLGFFYQKNKIFETPNIQREYVV
ncbi:hypothetical protein GCM10027189_10720 [Rufibacter soli]